MLKYTLLVLCLVGAAFAIPIDLLNSAQHLGDGGANVVSGQQKAAPAEDKTDITKISRDLEALTELFANPAPAPAPTPASTDDLVNMATAAAKLDLTSKSTQEDFKPSHQGDEESVLKTLMKLANNAMEGSEEATNANNLPMMRTTSGNPFLPWWLSGMSPYSWWSSLYGANYYNYPFPTSMSYAGNPWMGSWYGNYQNYASYPHLGSFDYDDISSASPYYGYPYTNAGFYPAGYSIPWAAGTPYYGGAYYGAGVAPFGAAGYAGVAPFGAAGYAGVAPFGAAAGVAGAAPYSWGYPGGFGAAYVAPGYPEGVTSA